MISEPTQARPSGGKPGRVLILTCLAVALLTLLPFARGLASGQCFYFRDLSRQFFPLRRFALEGLLKGELRYWNPLLHEGEPLSLPPISYPLDLLQLALRDETGLSLLLALHVPLGALAFIGLARGLGVSLAAAAGGGIVYALGGFYLSTLNFYVYLQAAAWAPLVVLGLVRAAEGRPRWPALAALLVALALSTTGAEVVLQAILFGIGLSARRREPAGLGRMAGSLALGFGLAAPTLAVMRNAVAGSARAEGFPTEVVLAHSVHPLTLLQVLVGNLLGDLSNLANRWWGSNFFPLGFPYVLSLYLGASVLAVALVGALHGARYRLRLVLLALLAVFACMGRWAGMAPLVEALPPLHLFRHPAKLFFTVHLAVALLTSLGLDRLRSERALPAWRSLAALGIGLGGLLAGLPAIPHVFTGFTLWFLAGFTPPSYSWPDRLWVCDAIVSDAAIGGLAAVAIGLVALLVSRGRLAPARAVFAPLALMAADLLRTGSGLNPMVTPSFYRLSPEMTQATAQIRRDGGRVFACDPESGPAYFRARAQHPDHDVWTFAVFMETLTPAFNMDAAVPTAYSRDLTMLVPLERVLSPEEVGSGAFASVAKRLRSAGVSVVVSPEPIQDDALRLRQTVAPARIAPMAIHLYDVERPLPLRYVAREVRWVADRSEAVALASQPGFLERGAVAVEGLRGQAGGSNGRVTARHEGATEIDLEVDAERPSVVVLRDAYDPGWSARVDGAEVPVLRADGRHRAVPVPSGHSRIRLRYRPPGLAAGLIIASLSTAILAALLVRRRRGPTFSIGTPTGMDGERA